LIKIKTLWADAVVQETYTKANSKFMFNDSALYFLKSLDRISEPNYIPSVDDIVRCRLQTTAVHESTFHFEDLTFRMIDVGGQKTQRKKWLSFFEGVTAVIFCVAINEFDLNLREQRSQNRMMDSLMLFEDISNNQWFRNTAFLLFLNKIDLFKEKIQRVGLNSCFPDYQGGADYDAATNYIQQQFESRNHSPHPVFTHFTCAISTQSMSTVFKSVKEILLKRVLVQVDLVN